MVFNIFFQLQRKRKAQVSCVAVTSHC